MTPNKFDPQVMARKSLELRKKKQAESISTPIPSKSAPESIEASPFAGEIVTAPWGEELIVDEMNAISVVNYLEAGGKKFRLNSDGWGFNLDPKPDQMETWLIKKNADAIRSILIAARGESSESNGGSGEAFRALKFCSDAASICLENGDKEQEAKWRANAAWLAREIENDKSKDFILLSRLTFKAKTVKKGEQ